MKRGSEEKDAEPDAKKPKEETAEAPAPAPKEEKEAALSATDTLWPSSVVSPQV